MAPAPNALRVSTHRAEAPSVSCVLPVPIRLLGLLSAAIAPLDALVALTPRLVRPAMLASACQEIPVLSAPLTSTQQVVPMRVRPVLQVPSL